METMKTNLLKSDILKENILKENITPEMIQKEITKTFIGTKYFLKNNNIDNFNMNPIPITSKFCTKQWKKKHLKN